MARYYVSPSETLNRAVKAGLPEGIDFAHHTLWTRQGDMLSADLTHDNRSFRWVVTDRDMNDQEFAPGKFNDALAALVSLGDTPVPAPEPAAKPIAESMASSGDTLFEELFGYLTAPAV